MNFRDVELLSAYLDGRLSPTDTIHLESRLGVDPELKVVLGDLSFSRRLLHQLPQRRVPHDFTITPKMAGLKAPEPRAYPILRMAAGLATFLFIVTFAVNGFVPLAATHLAAAPAPAYGIGGGGGCDNCGPSESAPAATEAPAQPFSALESTETLPGVQDNSRTLSTPNSELSPKAVSPQPTINSSANVAVRAPISYLWQVFIGLFALICGATAWLLHLQNERKFHKRWNKK